MSRIVVFAAVALAAFFVAIPSSMWLARSPTDATQAERLGAEIGCTCPTCPHRPIATCGCSYAEHMLARLDTEVAAGRTDGEIMTLFVAEFGNGVKIKPEGSGFSLMAWLAPVAFLMVGAVAMVGVISHWRASSMADDSSVGKSPTNSDGGASDAKPVPSIHTADSDHYRAVVEQELDAFDD